MDKIGDRTYALMVDRIAALEAENERLKQQWGESDKAWLAARARVAELERAVMRARLELLEGECEPADNAVEILSAALAKGER